MKVIFFIGSLTLVSKCLKKKFSEKKKKSRENILTLMDCTADVTHLNYYRDMSLYVFKMTSKIFFSQSFSTNIRELYQLFAAWCRFHEILAVFFYCFQSKSQ